MSIRFLALLFVLHIVLVAQESDTGLPNISDRPQVEQGNLYMFGDVFYWYTTEAADWAAISKVELNSQTLTYKTVFFDWDLGFRIGVGYNTKYDGWDTSLYYTWFYTRTTGRIRDGSGEITPGFLGNRTAQAGTYQSARMSWELRYNILDWELGRRFFVSKNLSLRPFIGAKGGWIYQKIHTKWRREEDVLGSAVVINTFENMKNNFQGVGPKLGVNGKWILGNVQSHYFSLIADWAASFMWGWWRIKDRFHDYDQLTASTKVAPRNFGSLVLQALIGFGWDCNFRQDRSHFALRLGYEIQDWFNHYQVFDNGTGGHNNNLIFQGITLDLRFDF